MTEVDRASPPSRPPFSTRRLGANGSPGKLLVASPFRRALVLNHPGSEDLISLNVDELPAIEVGPGCVRRDLPGAPGAHVWVVEMAPDRQWPYLDIHDGPEQFFVVSNLPSTAAR
jgi:hypothetical protein